MAQAKFRGRFLWQELMTGDPAAASTFYSKLLGWQAKASGGEPAYTEFHVGDRGVAGMMQMPEAAAQMGAKPMWMPYIGVENVDEAVEDIDELGGKVHRPASDIPGVGRFAVLTDPQGAAFAVFRPNGEGSPGSAAAPKVGEFSWMELATTDEEEAFEFYSKLFGWQALARHPMGPAGTYLIFGSDGIQRGGMFKAGPERGPTPNWLPYASVSDVDVSAKEIPGFGGRVLAGPMDVPDNGRIVHLADPGGVLFAIYAQVAPKQHEPVAKPAAPAKAAAPKPAAKPAPAKAATPKPATLKPATAVTPAADPDDAPVAPPAAKKSLKPKKASPAPATPAAAPAAKKAATKATKKKAAKKAKKAKKAAKKAAKKVARKAAKKAAKKAVAKKKSAAKKKVVSKSAPKRAEKPARKTDKNKKRKKDKKKKDKGKKKKDKGKKDKARRKK